MKSSFTVLLLQHFLLVAFPHSSQEIRSSGAHSVLSEADVRHLEASQVPFLLFWLVSKIVGAVMVFLQRVSVSLAVTDLLLCPPVTPFASLSSSPVLFPTFHRLRSSSSSSFSSTFCVGPVTVGLSEARSSTKPC